MIQACGGYQRIPVGLGEAIILQYLRIRVRIDPVNANGLQPLLLIGDVILPDQGVDAIVL